MMYRYKALVEKVIDGDTIRLTIDLGFTVKWKSNCRLFGINAPELNSKDINERVKALEARQYLYDNLPIGSEIFIDSKELDKYGRPVIDIWFNGMNINSDMLKLKLVNEYSK